MARIANVGAAVLACAFSLIAQQRTLVVGGGSAPYAGITQAIAAARPGDRIFVASGGNYPAFTLTIGVDIDCTNGVTVDRIIIQGVPASQAVRIQGLTADSLTSTVVPRVLITNCQGPVHLHQVRVSGGIAISNCPAVALSSCNLDGDVNLGHGTGYTFPVQVTSANVAAHACNIRAFGGGALGAPAGVAGITMSGGHVALSACQVLGGRGNDGLTPCNNVLIQGSNGGPGVGGSGFLTASNGGSIAGGPRGQGCPLNDGPPFAGVTARVAPSVVLTGAGAQPLLIGEPPSLSMPATALPGTSVLVTVNGVSNRGVLLGLDLRNGWTLLPAADLPFVLSPAASLLAAAFPGMAPLATFLMPVPNAPWALNQFVYLQGVTVDGSGRIEFSNGGGVRIR